MKTLLNIIAILAIAIAPALADAKIKAGPRKGRKAGTGFPQMKVAPNPFGPKLR